MRFGGLELEGIRWGGMDKNRLVSPFSDLKLRVRFGRMEPGFGWLEPRFGGIESMFGGMEPVFGVMDPMLGRVDREIGLSSVSTLKICLEKTES